MIGASELKIAGVTAAASAIAAPEIAILGIGTNILLAALAGALFGLAYSPPGTIHKILPHKALGRYEAAGHVSVQLLLIIFGLCANAVIASWVAQIAPHLFSILKPVPHAAFAGVLAFGAQHLIPKAFAAAGGWLEKRAQQ